MCLFFVWKNITYMQYIRLEDVFVYAKIINLIVAFLGGSVSYFFGGWTELLQFLSLLVIVDYLTGLYASVWEARRGVPNSGLSSKKGSMGLAKKGIMFVIIAVMHRADIVLDMHILMTGAIWFYISNELISIGENLGRANILVPPQFKQIIAVLKDKTGEQTSQTQQPSQPENQNNENQN